MSANSVLPTTFRAVGVAKRLFLRLTYRLFHCAMRPSRVQRRRGPYHHLARRLWFGKGMGGEVSLGQITFSSPPL